MAIEHLTASNFDEVINTAKIALVDFWAPWCGPCKALGPVLEEAEKEIGTAAVVAKVNVEENSDIAARFSVMSIPTIIVFKDGKESSRSVGFIDKNAIIALAK